MCPVADTSEEYAEQRVVLTDMLFRHSADLLLDLFHRGGNEAFSERSTIPICSQHVQVPCTASCAISQQHIVLMRCTVSGEKKKEQRKGMHENKEGRG